MKPKDFPFNTGKMEKNGAARKKEEERTEKELARLKKEAAQREKDAAKRDYTLERSRIALERLQLNWIKWNITCMALGFSSYKFFRSRVEEGKRTLGEYVNGREIGIFLISIGFLMLLLATFQHRKNVAKLKSEYETMSRSLSLFLSYFILGFSIMILLLVVFKG
jgi:uncharacterized membrane protein YidH (DUF202 family)